MKSMGCGIDARHDLGLHVMYAGPVTVFARVIADAVLVPRDRPHGPLAHERETGDGHFGGTSCTSEE